MIKFFPPLKSTHPRSVCEFVYTSGVIYLIYCTKCGMQYLGETSRELYKKGREHIYNIENNKEAFGEHFNSINLYTLLSFCH